jgi:hypothetical protein
MDQLKLLGVQTPVKPKAARPAWREIRGGF